MVSVVVPIFNEQENLPELRRRLTEALEKTGEDWEVVLVNDGSRDASREMIRRYHQEDRRFKLVDLSRNFGHQPARSEERRVGKECRSRVAACHEKKKRERDDGNV